MDVQLTRITVPPRHTEDWMQTCEGESVNNPDDPDTTVVIVQQTARQMVLDVGPAALRDLIARADYYACEEYDDASVRAIQASARATLRRLEKDGHAHLLRTAQGSYWRPVRRDREEA